LKRIKKLQQNRNIEKVAKNLHFHKGEYDHKHTHLITPISADEIEKLNSINPTYAYKLFNIIEKSLDIEKEDSKNFYEAIQREQENEKLSIIKNYEDNKRTTFFAFFTLIFLTACGSILIYFGHKYIGGLLLSTVLVSIIQAILFKRKNKKEEELNK